MNTRLLILIIGMSVVGSAYAAPSTAPDGISSAGWTYATYFQNLANNPCSGDNILVWFTSTAGTDYLKGNCVNIGARLASFLGWSGSAPAGQAVVGFNAVTGNPTFWVVSGGGSGTGSWSLTGNTGTTAGTHFIGTTDAKDFVFKTNNIERLRITASGNIFGVGFNTNAYWIGQIALWNNAWMSMTWSLNTAIWGWSAGASMWWTGNTGHWGQLAWWLMTWSLNTAIWGYTAWVQMSWIQNTAVGWDGAGYTMFWIRNIAIWGYYAWNYMRGLQNTAIGWNQPWGSMAWTLNTAMGWSNPWFGMSWSYNTAVGWTSAWNSLVWIWNTIVWGSNGWLSLNGTYGSTFWGQSVWNGMGGSWNSAMGGSFAWISMGGYQGTAVGGYQVWVSMTWSNNTAIGGYFAWNAMLGFGNTAIWGYNATITDNTVQYSVVIGSGARSTQDGAIILGWSDVNVGIWLSNPSEKLDVNGNVKAAAFIYSSDRRLKTDIATLANVDAKLNALNGVSFVWKDSGRKDIGFIAQDVERILPELVHTGNNDLKSVEYGNITALLVEGYKYQKSRADSLEKRIEALEQANK